MTTYRELVTDIDYALRTDKGVGYWGVTFLTVLFLGQLGYSVYLMF